MHKLNFLYLAFLVLFTLLCKFVATPPPSLSLIPLDFAIKANKVDFEVDIQVFL